MAEGHTRTSTGQSEPCTTFVIVIDGNHILDIGYLQFIGGMTLGDLLVESDIKDVVDHPNPDSFGVCEL